MLLETRADGIRSDETTYKFLVSVESTLYSAIYKIQKHWPEPNVYVASLVRKTSSQGEPIECSSCGAIQ